MPPQLLSVVEAASREDALGQKGCRLKNGVLLLAMHRLLDGLACLRKSAASSHTKQRRHERVGGGKSNIHRPGGLAVILRRLGLPVVDYGLDGIAAFNHRIPE